MTVLHVQRLDGEHFDITADDQKVRDLKDIICKHWSVPPLCQQLIVGSTILDDAESIEDRFLENDEQTCVTMLISFDRINSDLLQGHIQAQKHACDTLCQLITDKTYSQLLRSRACAIIVGLFQQTWKVDSVVKCLAVKALGALVQQGRRDAVSALCICVSDADQSVRNAAVTSLRFLQEEDHVYALCALTSYLTHPQWQIRCAAVKGLDSFTKVGNEDVIEVVKNLAADPDDSVRMYAVQAWNRIAQRGCNRGSIAACNSLRFTY